jgi:hypothetical protein
VKYPQLPKLPNPCPLSPASTGMWTPRDGVPVPLSSMTTKHVNNARAQLLREPDKVTDDLQWIKDWVAAFDKELGRRGATAWEHIRYLRQSQRLDLLGRAVCHVRHMGRLLTICENQQQQLDELRSELKALKREKETPTCESS